MQQAVTNNTDRINETSTVVTTLAAGHQQLEPEQKQTEEQMSNMQKQNMLPKCHN